MHSEKGRDSQRAKATVCKPRTEASEENNTAWVLDS